MSQEPAVSPQKFVQTLPEDAVKEPELTTVQRVVVESCEQIDPTQQEEEMARLFCDIHSARWRGRTRNWTTNDVGLVERQAWYAVVRAATEEFRDQWRCNLCGGLVTFDGTQPGK